MATVIPKSKKWYETLGESFGESFGSGLAESIITAPYRREYETAATELQNAYEKSQISYNEARTARQGEMLDRWMHIRPKIPEFSRNPVTGEPSAESTAAGELLDAGYRSPEFQKPSYLDYTQVDPALIERANLAELNLRNVLDQRSGTLGGRRLGTTGTSDDVETFASKIQQSIQNQEFQRKLPQWLELTGMTPEQFRTISPQNLADLSKGLDIINKTPGRKEVKVDNYVDYATGMRMKQITLLDPMNKDPSQRVVNLGRFNLGDAGLKPEVPESKIDIDGSGNLIRITGASSEIVRDSDGNPVKAGSRDTRNLREIRVADILIPAGEENAGKPGVLHYVLDMNTATRVPGSETYTLKADSDIRWEQRTIFDSDGRVIEQRSIPVQTSTVGLEEGARREERIELEIRARQQMGRLRGIGASLGAALIRLDRGGDRGLGRPGKLARDIWNFYEGVRGVGQRLGLDLLGVTDVDRENFSDSAVRTHIQKLSKDLGIAEDEIIGLASYVGTFYFPERRPWKAAEWNKMWETVEAIVGAPGDVNTQKKRLGSFIRSSMKRVNNDLRSANLSFPEDEREGKYPPIGPVFFDIEAEYYSHDPNNPVTSQMAAAFSRLAEEIRNIPADEFFVPPGREFVPVATEGSATRTNATLWNDTSINPPPDVIDKFEQGSK